MNREAESVDAMNLEASSPTPSSEYPKITDKITRAEISQRIKDSVAHNDNGLLESLFNFMLVNDYTPEQIEQEIDYIGLTNPPLLSVLVTWSEQAKDKKKLKILGKAAFLAVVIYSNNKEHTAAIKVIERFKSFNDAPHEFTEAVDNREIESWLGLLQHELDNQVPLTNIMRQLEALRLKHIWSKDLAVFAIPITTAYFRELATDKMLNGDYISAYRDLEQALKLPEEDRTATYQSYADCIVKQINDPLFRSRASKEDLLKLGAKMEYLHDVDFWTPELDISRFHLKNMTGDI